MKMGLDAVIKLVLEEMKKAFSDKKLISEIAQEVVETIRKRTRVGKGLDGNQITNLKRLDDNNIKQQKPRRYINFRKTYPKLSSKTTPAKSNLTLTGEMLDDLTFKLKGSDILRKVEIAIYEEESRKKARWVTDGGRPFLGLSDNEKKFIIRLLFKKVEERINKNLSKISGKTFDI